MSADAIAELEDRLRRYPADRFPVQHATTRYHLGVALTADGRLGEAEAALVAAAEIFHGRLPAEMGKTLNALGAVLRESGRPDRAAEAFRRAEEMFAEQELPLERGAALYNLALVEREMGHIEEAVRRFSRAAELLDERRVPPQTAAALREVGATLVMAGRLAEAIEPLRRAVDLADRGGDQAGMGAAANALGLALLGLGRVEEAVAAFRDAVAANPRTIRPDANAMAKANLALAYERAGDHPRARLTALQALATPQAAPPVRDQAAGTVERLGSEPGELLTVLRDEPQERWAAVVRDEVTRWVDADPGSRRLETAAWIEGQAGSDLGVDLAEAWLGALLELPPQEMATIIRGAIEALGDLDPEVRRGFRTQTEAGMARFHVPQLIRLKDAFRRTAEEMGREDLWA